MLHALLLKQVGSVHIVVQGTDPQSIDAELALQRKLAKQLGIKGKSAAKKADPADNLDEFLTGDILCCYAALKPFHNAKRRTLDHASCILPA